MKKLVALTLVLLMCLGFVFSVSAAEENSKGRYEELFAQRLKLNLDENGEDMGFCLYEDIYFYYGDNKESDEPEYALVFASSPMVGPMPLTVRIGDYAVYSIGYYDPYELGYFIYVPAEDRIYTLEEAYEAGIENVDKVFTESSIKADLIGDANNDKSVNIKDVSWIQKKIANLIDNKDDPYEDIDGYYGLTVCDFDRDDNLTVKDASAIQKAIAGLDINAPDAE